MEKNKLSVVWITGATKGIGAAIAAAFGTIDCAVVLSGRNEEVVRKNVEAINLHGGNAAAVVCDITSEKSVMESYSIIESRFGGVNVLINNAGVTAFKTFEESTIEDFDYIVNTNLRGFFLCTKAVLPAMLRNKTGHIITIHSVSARDTFLRSSVYAASKAGALAMTKGLRAEVRKSGIKVIDVLPGATETEMWNEGVRKKYRDKMMQPEDVAEVVLSLYLQPKNVNTDEIIIRPVEGDL